MSLKTQIASDLDTFFNIGEFAEEVEYSDGVNSSTVTVQFFDEESDLGDTMMRKLILKKEDLLTLSKDGYFIINSTKYGVIDFMPDEQMLIQQVILQKVKR